LIGISAAIIIPIYLTKCSKTGGGNDGGDGGDGGGGGGDTPEPIPTGSIGATLNGSLVTGATITVTLIDGAN
jgi:hypothetical protein